MIGIFDVPADPDLGALLRIVIMVVPFSVIGFSSLVVSFRMVELINQKRSVDQEVEYVWWYPGKSRNVRALYRELYPNGRLADWEIGLSIVGAAWGLFAAVVVLRIF